MQCCVFIPAPRCDTDHTLYANHTPHTNHTPYANHTPHSTPPLKLVITSATLEGEKFSAHFYNAPVLQVPGRCFEVQLIHATEDHDRDYLSTAVDTVLQIHTTQPPGSGRKERGGLCGRAVCCVLQGVLIVQ